MIDSEHNHHLSIIKRVHPKTLCILFSDTKGIQWVDTDATDALNMTGWASQPIVDLDV